MEDTGDYFSLKWSDFRSSLTEGFHDFLQEETMVDVTLAAEGKFVQAHKLVLSVCSPYFKNLFKVNPCKHPIVFLKDVALNDLSYMLDFMYRGEVGVKHEDLPSFLKLAETLKVKGLAGEKFQKNLSYTSNNLDSNNERVRKKASRESVFDVNKENSEFQSCGEKKMNRSKRKKFQCKSKPVKKLKGEKCSAVSVIKCLEKSNDNMSEDEDNNPLIKLVKGDSEKSIGSSTKSVSQCDNKMNFDAWDDDVPDSDDSGEPDVSSIFHSEYSEETETPPQDVNRENRVVRKTGIKSSLARLKQRLNKIRERARTSRLMETRLNGRLHLLLRGIKRDCKVCSKRNIPGGRRQTTYFCDTCPEKPRLHMGTCFHKYHTENRYRV